MKNEEPSDELMAAGALDHAAKAFQDYISKEGLNPAYFDIRFTAWVVDSGFEKRLARIEIERELK